MARTTDEALALWLKRLALRSELDEAERQAILGLPGEAVAVAAGQDFVRVGERVDHACLIVEGLAARFAQLGNGQRGVVAFHIPGDMADLHSVVARQVTWALQAAAPSRILRIPHAALDALATEHPRLAIAFWRDCIVDANVLAQWTVNIARKDSAARVAHLLCELFLRYRAAGLSGYDFFPFPITQVMLADAVGLTPIHLNRVLKRLRDERLATKDLYEIVLKNGEGLVALGEFDPAYLQFPDTTPKRPLDL